eukprot:3264298-Amphidinium_carterae.1
MAAHNCNGDSAAIKPDTARYLARLHMQMSSKHSTACEPIDPSVHRVVQAVLAWNMFLEREQPCTSSTQERHNCVNLVIFTVFRKNLSSMHNVASMHNLAICPCQS